MALATLNQRGYLVVPSCVVFGPDKAPMSACDKATSVTCTTREALSSDTSSDPLEQFMIGAREVWHSTPDAPCAPNADEPTQRTAKS